jgi:hypothetical protein
MQQALRRKRICEPGSEVARGRESTMKQKDRDNRLLRSVIKGMAPPAPLAV